MADIKANLKKIVILLALFPVISLLLQTFLNDSDTFQHAIIVFGPILYLVGVVIAMVGFLD